MDGHFSNEYIIFFFMQCVHSAIYVCSRMYHKKYTFFWQGNKYNNIWSDQATQSRKYNSFWNKMTQSTYIMYQWIQSLLDYRCTLCNALPTGYQRTYMCCTIYQQRPKTQRILNPLVRMLATLIWAFRYGLMRCCRGGVVVVNVCIELCLSICP